MKGDRRTAGLELAALIPKAQFEHFLNSLSRMSRQKIALIPKAQFEAFFKQFEQDEPASENSGLNEPPPANNSDSKAVDKNQRLKGDRRTAGLELESALIPKAQFEAFFKQFEQDEPASENSGLNEPPPANNSDSKAVDKNQRLKGDRRTAGLELESALIPKAQFEAFFKQFEQDEPASENSGLNEPTEILEIDNYQVLHLKDAEFPYLTIIYTAEKMILHLLFMHFVMKAIVQTQIKKMPLRLLKIFMELMCIKATLNKAGMTSLNLKRYSHGRLSLG